MGSHSSRRARSYARQSRPIPMSANTALAERLNAAPERSGTRCIFMPQDVSSQRTALRKAEEGGSMPAKAPAERSPAARAALR